MVVCPIGWIGGLAKGIMTVLVGITVAQGIPERCFDGSVLQEAAESISKGT